MRHLRLSAVAALALLGACAERATAPELTTNTPSVPSALQALDCTVSLASRAVTCGGPAAGAAGVSPLIVGGQGVYVQLASANVAYDAATHRFSFNTTVQNLIPQALGTADGSTADANGLRIFFVQQPTATAGTGTVQVLDADGTGTFTATGQPFYRYSGADLGADGLLSPNETSAARAWAFDVPATVGAFTFKVYVDAAVKLPDGWVDLGLTSPYLLTGQSIALAPIVRTATGTAITAPVTYGSSNATAATIDGNGTLATLAPGRTTLTATAGARTGTAAVSVCPNLAPGEAWTFSGAAAAALCLGGQGATSEYVAVVHNAAQSGAATMTTTATNIQAVTGPPTPALIPADLPTLSLSRVGGTAGVASLGRAGGDPTPIDFGAVLRAREAATLPSLAAARVARPSASKFGLRRRGLARQPGGASYAIITGVVPAIDDIMDLDVASGCSGTPTLHGSRVRSVSLHAIVVEDTLNPAGGFTTAQYDSIAAEFDTLAYRSDSAAFGPPTDNDHNGRVVLYFTRAVNELSPPASSSVTLGYFDARDVFAASDAGCTRSNEGEMMYMLVPDPTGAVNSNVRTVSYVRGNTTGTLAQELQHLTNAWRRVYVNNATLFEEHWLDEGLAHIAEEQLFFRASGLTAGTNINLSTLTTGANASRRVAAFNTYANQNYGRFRTWLQRPDTAGPYTSSTAPGLATRGAIWAFLRYSADRAGGTEGSIWYALENSGLTGRANVAAAFGGIDVDAWMRDFAVAAYTDDIVGNTTAKYGASTWNMRSVYGGLGGFPLLVRPLTSGTPLTVSLAAGGGVEYLRLGSAVSAFSDLVAAQSGGAPAATTSVTVFRTK